MGNCSNCKAIVSEVDNFCTKCGNRLKCKSCNTSIKEETSYCPNCGEEIDKAKSTSVGYINTIKYRKSDAETSCEISFTDQVGKERMSDFLLAIVNNRFVIPATYTESGIINPLELGGTKYNLNEQEPVNPSSLSEQSLQDTEELPHLKDVENRADFAENLWIAVYAFYLSEYGIKNFDKAIVREAYMERRKTKNRVKNFAMEWNKAHSKYFKTINDKELSFQNGVLEDIKNLILGNNSKPKSKNKKTAGLMAKKTPGKSVSIEEFDLSSRADPNKPSLEEFFLIKKPGSSTHDRIVTIAYYITRLNGLDSFTEGQIEFAYKALQLNERPGHLRQIINNIKNAKVWFKDISPGRWSLERIGEIYVDEKLPMKEIV